MEGYKQLYIVSFPEFSKAVSLKGLDLNILVTQWELRTFGCYYLDDKTNFIINTF